MMEFNLSDNRNRLEKEVEALKWQLEHDTNDKDIKYHIARLKAVEEKLEGLNDNNIIIKEIEK